MQVIILDVETTGLNPEQDMLLEVGGLKIDLGKIGITDAFRRRIHHDVIIGNPTAIVMNIRLLRLMLEDHSGIVNTEGAIADLEDWITCSDLDLNKKVWAGKNPHFDRGFLFYHDLSSSLFHHRCLDPGPLYTRPTDEMPPNLKTCCERAGILQHEDTLHNAMDDCWDVARCLWAHYLGEQINDRLCEFDGGKWDFRDSPLEES